MVLIEPRTECEMKPALRRSQKNTQVDGSCYSLRMGPMEEEVLGRTLVVKFWLF